MKTLLFATLLLIAAITSQAQVSIDAGLTSYLGATVKVGYEVTTKSGLNVEAATRLAVFGTTQLSPGLLVGKQLNTYRGSFKAYFGAYYNILKPSESDKEAGVKYKPFTFGGGFRWEINQGTWGLEYNGRYASLTVGFLFR